MNDMETPDNTIELSDWICKSVDKGEFNNQIMLTAEGAEGIRCLVFEYRRILKQRNSLRDAFLNKESIGPEMVKE